MALHEPRSHKLKYFNTAEKDLQAKFIQMTKYFCLILHYEQAHEKSEANHLAALVGVNRAYTAGAEYPAVLKGSSLHNKLSCFLGPLGALALGDVQGPVFGFFRRAALGYHVSH